MKKKKIALKKLSLNKEVIAALDGVQQQRALGGGDSVIKWEMCNYSQQPSCNDNCVTVKGQTCEQLAFCIGTNNSCISCAGGTGCPTRPPYCQIGN
ncbi:class I lanthipeptide [Taibaiella chishuiensis]|uniref:Uncharacterized protein n=1 Tax=Taibaiella chishuiensis TaxID=1434707 RepID=A0A2P8CWY8_9BACT|nr:class I lanthipeptide [Taibaiella chishuiensis]PSK89481.1 hypothetical protein B0I18_11135 [Taibaiella chishuiensis]